MLLLAIAGGLWYVLYGQNEEQRDLLSFFAPEPVFVMHMPEPAGLLEQFNNQQYAGLLRNGGTYEQLQYAFTNWNYLNQDSSSEKSSASIYAAAYITSAGKFDMLFARKVEAITSAGDTELYEGVEIKKEELSGSSWYSFVEAGVQVASSNRVLIEDAIRQMNSSEALSKSSSFKSLQDLAGPEPLSIYVYLPQLSEYFKMFLTTDAADVAEKISDFADWFRLDVNFFESQIFFNGYAQASGKAINNLGQVTADAIGIESVLPAQSPFYYAWQDKDASKPFSGYQAIALNDLIGENIDESLVWVLHGVAPETLKDFLAGEVLSNFELNEVQSYSNQSSWPISDGYASVQGSFLLLSKSETCLSRLNEQIASRKSLLFQSNYRDFREQFSEQSSAMLFMQLNSLLRPATNWVQEKYADSLLSKGDQLQMLDPFGIQFDRFQNYFLVSGFWSYGQSMELAEGQFWASKMDTSLSWIHAVENHVDQSTEYLVQDASNRLSLYNQRGQALWTRQLEGAVMGDVYQIDYYKNDKLQYLLNTSGKIHLIDRKGRDVADYPIEFSSRSSASLFAVDYDSKKDWRIFVPAENGNIYGYYKTGRPLPGWSPLRNKNAPAYPIMHHVAAGKDYLIAVDRTGKLSLRNRKGEERVDALELGAPALNPPKIIKRAGEDQIWICDTIGMLHKVRLDGSQDVVPLPKINSRSEFLIIEQGDDLMFASTFANDLELRSAEGLKKWTVRLPEGPHRMEAFEIRGEIRLGIWSQVSSEWSVFDLEGNLLSDFPIQGESPFWLQEDASGSILFGYSNNQFQAIRLSE
jgi:hypothetical protein